MIIYLATDHAGFDHKNLLKDWLLNNTEHEVRDCGSFVCDENDDYPEYIAKAARAVSLAPEESRAIIFGGSGQGEAMLANHFRNVRAAVFYGGPVEVVELSRQHNDANILSIGARFVTADDLFKVVEVWLNTKPAVEDKYKRRINQASDLYE